MSNRLCGRNPLLEYLGLAQMGISINHNDPFMHGYLASGGNFTPTLFISEDGCYFSEAEQIKNTRTCSLAITSHRAAILGGVVAFFCNFFCCMVT